jgi:hypothetical protein
VLIFARLLVLLACLPLLRSASLPDCDCCDEHTESPLGDADCPCMQGKNNFQFAKLVPPATYAMDIEPCVETFFVPTFVPVPEIDLLTLRLDPSIKFPAIPLFVRHCALLN